MNVFEASCVKDTPRTAGMNWLKNLSYRPMRPVSWQVAQ